MFLSMFFIALLIRMTGQLSFVLSLFIAGSLAQTFNPTCEYNLSHY